MTLRSEGVGCEIQPELDPKQWGAPTGPQNERLALQLPRELCMTSMLQRGK